MSSSRQWVLGLFYLLLLHPPAPASPWGHLPAQPHPAQLWEMPAGAHSGPLANFCNTIITGHSTEEGAGCITPLVFLQHLCRSFHLHTLTLFPHGGKTILPLTLHHSLLCVETWHFMWLVTLARLLFLAGIKGSKPLQIWLSSSLDSCFASPSHEFAVHSQCPAQTVGHIYTSTFPMTDGFKEQNFFISYWDFIKHFI